MPTGSTEQHGPHAPLLTDVLIPQEVARRVAAAGRRRRGAADQLRPVVSARRVHRRRARPDPDVHGAHRGPVRLARGGRVPADRLPQRPLRQHLRDRLRLRERGGPDARGRARLPGQLLGRHDRRRGGGVLRPVERAPREPRRDVGRARHRPGTRGHGPGERRVPAVPGGRRIPPRSTPRSSSRAPGSVHGATQSGTWGDAREASAEFGERYLEVVVEVDDPPARRHRARRSRRCRRADHPCPKAAASVGIPERSARRPGEARCRRA